REELTKSQPGLAYNQNESNEVVESEIYRMSLDDYKNNFIDLKNILKGKEGSYRISFIAPDGTGKELTSSSVILIYNPKSKNPVSGNAFEVYNLGKNTYQPGDVCKLLFSTSLNNLKLKYTIKINNKIISEKYITVNNTTAIITIPVTEEMRGNFIVSFLAINNYRMYDETLYIDVPYSNKQLQVKLGSFRDKLQPGAKETWTMTVKGSKGEAFAAEMMAGMYDESLDQFTGHNWSFFPWNDNYSSSYQSNIFTVISSSDFRFNPQYYLEEYEFSIPDLIENHNNYVSFRGFGRGPGSGPGSSGYASVEFMSFDGVYPIKKSIEKESVSNFKVIGDPKNFIEKNQKPIITPRTNFNETAFFYPQLRTDKNGAIKFEFTMPEALTRWKFMALAHGKKLETGSLTQSIVTQKELMVVPDLPRFFRNGDNLTIVSKISNLSTKALSGNAQIEITDTETGEVVKDVLVSATQLTFNVGVNKTTSVSWNIKIPTTHSALTIKITASSENFSDGESHTIPVLSSKVHITESLPLSMRQVGEKSFTFDHLKNNTSSTLQTDKVVVEMTSNPAWYAVQALPYMMEFPHECAEQIFNRYYSNAIASHLANKDSLIRNIFNQWARTADKDSASLISNLQKNEDLKSLLLEETPWVMDAKNETQNKKNLGKLFNKQDLILKQKSAAKLLEQKQLPSGAWSWFDGMNENPYITKYILTGFGRLKKLDVDISENAYMLNNTIEWLDREAAKNYTAALD
ncbi:MAG: hypothetical protein H7321_06955, partial [Bacteroidia bacterium]|nr:hypothetical protein [Bacteroidia bacterium]